MQLKTLSKLSSILLMSSLISCAHATTETAPRTIHDYCLLAKGLNFAEPHGADREDQSNKYDTAETVKQLKDHDLVYDKICGVASTNG